MGKNVNNEDIVIEVGIIFVVILIFLVKDLLM